MGGLLLTERERGVFQTVFNGNLKKPCMAALHHYTQEINIPFRYARYVGLSLTYPISFNFFFQIFNIWWIFISPFYFVNPMISYFRKYNTFFS